MTTKAKIGARRLLDLKGKKIHNTFMSLIESCFNELKFSLSNSMLGRNIEIQYHLQRNDFSSRNANPNVDLETLDNNLRLPNNDNNPSPMTVETPIFPQSIDHES